MVAVYDGRACLGQVLGRGRAGFEAFDAARSLISVAARGCCRHHWGAVSHGAHALDTAAGPHG